MIEVHLFFEQVCTQKVFHFWTHTRVFPEEYYFFGDMRAKRAHFFSRLNIYLFHDWGTFVLWTSLYPKSIPFLDRYACFSRRILFFWRHTREARKFFFDLTFICSTIEVHLFFEQVCTQNIFHFGTHVRVARDFCFVCEPTEPISPDRQSIFGGAVPSGYATEWGHTNRKFMGIWFFFYL